MVQGGKVVGGKAEGGYRLLGVGRERKMQDAGSGEGKGDAGCWEWEG